MSIASCMQVRTMAMDKKGPGSPPNSIYRQNNDISALPLIVQPLQTCQRGLAHAVTWTSKSAARKMMSQEITNLSACWQTSYMCFKYSRETQRLRCVWQYFTNFLKHHLNQDLCSAIDGLLNLAQKYSSGFHELKKTTTFHYFPRVRVYKYIYVCMRIWI